MTDIQTKADDKFTLFRHVRNGEVATTGGTRVSNLGGVTLFLEVDQATATFQFAFAVAGTKENFSKKVAKDISQGRFNKGQVIAGSYNRGKSLVDNCIDALQDVVTEKAFINVKESQVTAALTRLLDFSANLPRAPFTGERAKGTVVSPAAWPFPKTTPEATLVAELG